MIGMSVHLTGDCWVYLKDKQVLGADEIGFALLDKGMESGLPAVAIRLDLPDGRVVVGQMSARLFCTAARMFVAKHPELFAVA